MHSRRIALIAILAAILVALGITSAFLKPTAAVKSNMNVQVEPESLYDVGTLPDFTLTDATGEKFSGAALAGKI
ncbi:MAG: hypothetical protein IT364_07205, partial [Candidatus Hydrogenedentes bacterium]|nr:hypothetical protein [Candidatus Hydrogenedentota bacterium]